MSEDNKFARIFRKEETENDRLEQRDTGSD